MINSRAELRERFSEELAKVISSRPNTSVMTELELAMKIGFTLYDELSDDMRKWVVCIFFLRWIIRGGNNIIVWPVQEEQ